MNIRWLGTGLLLLGTLATRASDGRTELSQAMMPLTISNPGSYVLTQNLTADDADGITLEADHVTLDLNGFHLVGGSGEHRGIRVSGDRRNLAVFNGTVRDWGLDGVDLLSASNCIVRDLRLEGNGADGVSVGPASRVSGCLAVNNGTSSAHAGIRASDASLVLDCVTRANGGAGIRTGVASLLRGCVARENAGHGMVAGEGANIIGCNARDNGEDGFVLGAGSRISACVSYSNEHGIRFTGNGGGAAQCTLYGNTAFGLRGGDGLTVTGCTAYDNSAGGFSVSNACHLVSNNAVGLDTGAPGFELQGDATRAEANHAVRADAGFELNGDKNLLVKNSASECNDEIRDNGTGNKIGGEQSDPAVAKPWDNIVY